MWALLVWVRRSPILLKTILKMTFRICRPKSSLKPENKLKKNSKFIIHVVFIAIGRKPRRLL